MYITIKQQNEAGVKDDIITLSYQNAMYSIQGVFKNDIFVSIDEKSLIPFKLACNKFANRRLKVDSLYISLLYTTQINNVTHKSKNFWMPIKIKKIGNKNYLALAVSNTTEATLFNTMTEKEMQVQIEKMILYFDEFNCGAIDMFFSPKKIEQHAK